MSEIVWSTLARGGQRSPSSSLFYPEALNDAVQRYDMNPESYHLPTRITNESDAEALAHSLAMSRPDIPLGSMHGAHARAAAKAILGDFVATQRLACDPTQQMMNGAGTPQDSLPPTPPLVGTPPYTSQCASPAHGVSNNTLDIPIVAQSHPTETISTNTATTNPALSTSSLLNPLRSGVDELQLEVERLNKWKQAMHDEVEALCVLKDKAASLHQQVATPTAPSPRTDPPPVLTLLRNNPTPTEQKSSLTTNGQELHRSNNPSPAQQQQGISERAVTPTSTFTAPRGQTPTQSNTGLTRQNTPPASVIQAAIGRTSPTLYHNAAPKLPSQSTTPHPPPSAVTVASSSISPSNLQGGEGNPSNIPQTTIAPMFSGKLQTEKAASDSVSEIIPPQSSGVGFRPASVSTPTTTMTSSQFSSPITTILHRPQPTVQATTTTQNTQYRRCIITPTTVGPVREVRPEEVTIGLEVVLKPEATVRMIMGIEWFPEISSVCGGLELGVISYYHPGSAVADVSFVSGMSWILPIKALQIAEKKGSTTNTNNAAAIAAEDALNYQNQNLSTSDAALNAKSIPSAPLSLMAFEGWEEGERIKLLEAEILERRVLIRVAVEAHRRAHLDKDLTKHSAYKASSTHPGQSKPETTVELIANRIPIRTLTSAFSVGDAVRLRDPQYTKTLCETHSTRTQMWWHDDLIPYCGKGPVATLLEIMDTNRSFGVAIVRIVFMDGRQFMIPLPCVVAAAV
eukprot:PhF_6_TR41362/c0_g1_i1/m.62844